MTGSWQGVYNWTVTVNVDKNATHQTIQQQISAMMQGHAQNTFNKVVTDKGFKDAALSSVVIQIQSCGDIKAVPVQRKGWIGRLIPTGQVNYQVTATGATLINFVDDLPEAAIICGAIAGLIVVAIFAPEMLIVLGPTTVMIIIGVLVVTLLAAAYVEVATGTAHAIQLATQSPGGTIVTILLIIGGIIVAVLIFFTLMPDAFEWVKKKLSSNHHPY